MSRSAFLILSCLAFVGCKDEGISPSPLAQQAIDVYVYSGPSQGVPGIRVELLETGGSTTTDSAGMAQFVVLPGTYTLRFFGLNGPGPAPMYRDIAVTVSPGESQFVRVFDCLPCV